MRDFGINDEPEEFSKMIGLRDNSGQFKAT